MGNQKNKKLNEQKEYENLHFRGRFASSGLGPSLSRSA